MARVLLLGPARDAADGLRALDVAGSDVGTVIDRLVRRFGDPFTDVLATARIWVDGEPADGSHPVDDDSEVSILPPVSGG